MLTEEYDDSDAICESSASLVEGCRLPVRMRLGDDWPLAEIISIKDIKGVMQFYVHYVDFNKRLDEWVTEDRLDLRKVQFPRKDGTKEPGCATPKRIGLGGGHIPGSGGSGSHYLKMENSDDNAFSDDDVPSDIDLEDPYFKEELGQIKGKKKKVKRIEENPETEEDKQKKAELELLMLDNDSKDKHFSLKKIEEMENKKKKKGKKRKMEAEPEPADDFEINVNDERFSALYTSHHFNIDPTDPQYKPTKATKELIQEKLRRRAADEVVEKSGKLDGNKKPRNSELNVLVRNIKKNAAEMKRH